MVISQGTTLKLCYLESSESYLFVVERISLHNTSHCNDCRLNYNSFLCFSKIYYNLKIFNFIIKNNF